MTEKPTAADCQKPWRLIRSVQWGFVLGVTANIALIVYSLFRFPTSWDFSLRGLEGHLATTGILVVYALIGWFGTVALERRDVRIVRYGVFFGLLIGAFFAVMMLLEYLVSHNSRQNETLAKVIFGTFFLLLAVTGALATHATGRLWYGVLSAVLSALIGSLCWFILLLTTYYVFIGTPMEERFLEVDQVIADFQRSGMTDLRAFIIQDYLGGGFFHSLLGPLLAFPLGAIGGLAAKIWERLITTGRRS
jgi:heme/copper-type cytochrome/quinol oxidase subunit 3